MDINTPVLERSRLDRIDREERPRVPLRLPLPLHHALSEHAYAAGTSLNSLIVSVIRSRLDRAAAGAGGVGPRRQAAPCATVRIGVRMPAALCARLAERARRQRSSVNALVTDWLRDDQLALDTQDAHASKGVDRR
ncbi:MAG: hypothetical protein K2I40_05870 [Bifidobacterium castoris]|nr:hypothetical protein [Bifidobacterium castoris]